jgi:flagellar basal body-associated protein FliL
VPLNSALLVLFHNLAFCQSQKKNSDKVAVVTAAVIIVIIFTIVRIFIIVTILTSTYTGRKGENKQDAHAHTLENNKHVNYSVVSNNFNSTHLTSIQKFRYFLFSYFFIF